MKTLVHSNASALKVHHAPSQSVTFTDDIEPLDKVAERMLENTLRCGLNTSFAKKKLGQAEWNVLENNHCTWHEK